ncbi:MAG: septum formation inhibitor Maf [Bacteroides sp. SM23_62_1]|nr:MAG: septum formation inhibitor Maf [Bacteroides sp. SM23_62_1]
MVGNILKDYHVILASQSPRRQYLLKELGLDFEVLPDHEIDEKFPEELSKEEIPVYLAKKKADSVMPVIPLKTLLITADTIVWFKGKVISKPANHTEAVSMLHELSGSMHEVITGVCISLTGGRHTFYCSTLVWFAELSDKEINKYVTEYRPYDKAGAYGIQEWIGYIGIERIEGSYFNVMGLPVQKLYQELKKIIK